MQLFRHLANNIFFKIILAFVALTFVLFGVSGFILGNPNSWVAKVGSTTIGLNAFNKAIQADRDIILASNKSEEAVKYTESERFKSEVLGRLVNKIMIEKLHDNLGVSASKKLILQSVANDVSFKKDGKFDRETFKNFLAKNGLNEERYVNEISNDVLATMIIQTVSMVSPIDKKSVLEIENFKQEKRLADVITITEKNVTSGNKASTEEVQKFFTENKKKYALPEVRKISYLHFSAKDFAKELQISDAEITAEYEKNKNNFMQPESRNFLHALFENEDAAKNFLQKFDEAVKSGKSKENAEFAKLAKELLKKDQKAITLTKITQKGLIPELSEPIFKLAVGKRSDVLKSPLGFHIFLTTEIKPSQPISLADAKASIKHEMLKGREEKVLQAKITEIDDMLLTSNSLSEVAKKFGLKISSSAIKINQAGQNEKGEEVKEIKDLGGLVENAFTLQKDQASKIFQSKNSATLYALKVEEISPAHERELAEVKSQVEKDTLAKIKLEALQNLAQKIGAEVKENPSNVAKIAAKYNAKLEKNREFPRVYMINFQGRQVPYQNKFLDELFTLKVGEATGAIASGAQELVIGVLREVKKSSVNSSQFEQAEKRASEQFRNDIMQEYNKYLLEKNPVKVNDKILGKKDQK
jgi:peptidyl-prolyl cis-trans isomerase D